MNSTNLGWTCPVCNTGNNPYITYCPTCRDKSNKDSQEAYRNKVFGPVPNPNSVWPIQTAIGIATGPSPVVRNWNPNYTWYPLEADKNGLEQFKTLPATQLPLFP